MVGVEEEHEDGGEGGEGWERQTSRPRPLLEDRLMNVETVTRILKHK